MIATVGGGSVTDAAKAVQVCLSNNVTTPEGLDRLRAGSNGTAATIVAPTVRQVTVPTTLSAGEFSAISGVTNEATKSKQMLRHPLIVPKAVILDPAVTVHTPEWLWLSTGIRAVDRARDTPQGEAPIAARPQNVADRCPWQEHEVGAGSRSPPRGWTQGPRGQ